MAILTGEQRYFIVTRLATFEPYVDIIADFSIQFPGSVCTVLDVINCDPARGRMRDPILLAIFDDRRKSYLESEYTAPTADRRVRIVELDRLATFFKNNNQPMAQCTVLAQIAKEKADEWREKNDKNGAGDEPLEPIEGVAWEVVGAPGREGA